jgi:outer membrane lipoprotein-sorting protein
MKKRLLIGLLSTMFIFCLGLQAQELAVAEILAKNIEAQGGREAMAKFKDTTTSGTMEIIQMGMSASYTLYQKEPNKMRMDLDVMGMLITTAFDGEKGWAINPQTGTAEEMTEKQSQSLRLRAMGNDAALNPEKYGITYTLKGKETIGDKEYFVLEQTFKDGFQATVYINTVTYLTDRVRNKEDQMGTEIETETLMEDYKNVEGLMVPHALTIFQSGAEFGRIAITKVVFNTGLEDSFFKMQ